MDEPHTSAPAPSRLARTDLLLIVLLAVLTLGLRAYQLGTTEVTARDSIGYIHIAWRLEHYDWRKVIPDSPQHPGYPVAVLAASLPARLLFPNDLPYAMQLAAQLASAVASILLVVPLYWLGVQLFNRRVAFRLVLLFQCLPCSGRIMADGLSEGVFLLFAVTALAAAVHALRLWLAPWVRRGGGGRRPVLPDSSRRAADSGGRGPHTAGYAGFLPLAPALAARPRVRHGHDGGSFKHWRTLHGRLFTVTLSKASANALMKEATAEAEPPAVDGVASEPALLAVWWQSDARSHCLRPLFVGPHDVGRSAEQGRSFSSFGSRRRSAWFVPLPGTIARTNPGQPGWCCWCCAWS